MHFNWVPALAMNQNSILNFGPAKPFSITSPSSRALCISILVETLMTTNPTCAFYNLVTFLLLALFSQAIPIKYNCTKNISFISVSLNSEVSQAISIIKTYCSTAEIQRFNYVLEYIKIVILVINL